MNNLQQMIETFQACGYIETPFDVYSQNPEKTYSIDKAPGVINKQDYDCQLLLGSCTTNDEIHCTFFFSKEGKLVTHRCWA